MTENATIRNPFQQGSITKLIAIVIPGDTNHHGALFRGAGLALMDRVAFISTTRFGRTPFVTISCERIDFARAIEIGEIVEAKAQFERIGRSAMTIETELWSENLLPGERHVNATGRFTMIAVDKDDRPVPVRDGQSAEKAGLGSGQA